MSEIKKEPATAIILAGGKSSRMGRAKALLEFAGEPLIVHLVRRLEQLFTDTVVVVAPEQELPALPSTIVRDDVAYQGPVGGIYYGLKAAREEICFVTSCDAPFLNLTLISYLIAQISNYDVVVPFTEGRYQPLHAVYRRSCAPLLKIQLERSELRPIFLYEKVRTRKITEAEMAPYDPDGSSFLNMNSPEDYQAAQARWSALSISVTVELFGVAQLLAKTKEVPLTLAPDTTLAQVCQRLAVLYPVLLGRVINPDQRSLAAGYACNRNGLEFVKDPNVALHPGDKLFIIAADAGG